MQKSQHILHIFQAAQKLRLCSHLGDALQRIAEALQLDADAVHLLHIVQVRIFFGQRNNFVIPAAKALLQKFLQRLLAALRQLGAVKPQ